MKRVIKNVEVLKAYQELKKFHDNLLAGKINDDDYQQFKQLVFTKYGLNDDIGEQKVFRSK